MKYRGRKFELNKTDGKFLGVCSGLSDYTGVDATIIRVGVVLATVVGGFPWTVIAYFIAAMMAKPKSTSLYGARQPRISSDEARERMRALDLRLQAIETHVTSTNSQLAREIEDLR